MFMTPFGDDDQSYAIADYTYNQLGARRVVVWTDNSMDFTKALSKFFKERFIQLGGQVVLEDFFSVDPDPSLVRLVKKKLKDLPTKDIRASLRRVHATFDFPVDPTTFFGKPTRASQRAEKRTRRTARSQAAKKGVTRRKSGKAHIGVSLAEIIEAGLLRTPLKLMRHYKGHDLEAELLPNGTVLFEGETHKTCSRAAEHARGTITGRRMNTNGWSFWQYRDEDDNLVELDTARQELLKRKS